MPINNFTEETKNRIYAAIATGNTLGTSAAMAGIGRSTLMGWLQKGRQGDDPRFQAFALKLDEHKAIWESTIVQAIQVEGDARTKLELLSRRNPTDWAASSKTISVVNDRFREFMDYMCEALRDKPDSLKDFLECASAFSSQHDLEIGN